MKVLPLWKKIRRIFLVLCVQSPKSKGQVTLPCSESVQISWISRVSRKPQMEPHSPELLEVVSRTYSKDMALLMKKFLSEVRKFISSVSLTPLSRLQLISKVCSKAQAVTLLLMDHTAGMWLFLLNSNCPWAVCVCVLILPHTAHTSTQGPIGLCKFMPISISIHVGKFHPSDKDQGMHPLLHTLHSNNLGLIWCQKNSF